MTGWRVVLAVLLLWPAIAAAAGLDDIRRGNEAFRAERYEAAIAAYTEAILSGELDVAALALAYNNRGVVYNELGDFDRAIADYTESLALVPGDATVLRNLRVAYTRRGVAAANFGQFARALDDLGRAIELDPAHHLAWLRRAEVRMRMGDFEGALRDLDEARARRPGDPEIEVVSHRLSALRAAAATEVAEKLPPAGAPPAAGRGPAGAMPTTAAGNGETAAPTAADTGGAATAPAGEAQSPPQQEGAPHRVIGDVNVRAGPGNDQPVVAVARRGQLLRVVGEVRGWKKVVFESGMQGFVYRRWLEPVVSGDKEG